MVENKWRPSTQVCQKVMINYGFIALSSLFLSLPLNSLPDPMGMDIKILEQGAGFSGSSWGSDLTGSLALQGHSEGCRLEPQVQNKLTLPEGSTASPGMKLPCSSRSWGRDAASGSRMLRASNLWGRGGKPKSQRTQSGVWAGC